MKKTIIDSGTGNTCERYILSNCYTALDALQASKTDWIAEPINTLTESGIMIPDRFKYKAYVRSDNHTVIGVVGKNYSAVQNADAFSFFDTVVQQNGGSYDFINIINGGSKIILQAKISSKPILIRKDDEVFAYANLINSFDGSSNLLSMSYFWRKVCENGLVAGVLKSKTAIKHTGTIPIKIEEALRIMGISLENIQEFKNASKILAAKSMKKSRIDIFIKQTFGNLKEVGSQGRPQLGLPKVMELFENGKGTGKGTAWDMYNAYTEWIDHYRSETETLRMANQVYFSTGMKEEAFDILLKV